MRGINIKGQSIQTNTNYDLFCRKNNRNGAIEFEKKKYSVIYGRNGSGKTTIAKAIIDYKNEDTTTFETYFYDSEMKEIDINKDNIHVFSESFVNDNIMVSEDGKLNAIVLFGKAGDIDKEINTLKAKIENNIKTIAIEDLDKYHRVGDDKNIDKVIDDLTKELKNHWASREQRIKGSQRKSSVDDSMVMSLCLSTKPNKTLEELNRDYNDLIEKIEKVRELPGPVNNITLELNINHLDHYNSLLTTSFSKNEMTSFAAEVLAQIEGSSSRYLEDSKRILSSPGRCPLCFQLISFKYGSDTIQVIDSLFDKTIQNEKMKLENSLIPTILLPDFNGYNSIISLSLFNELKTAIDKLNECINNVNDALKDKIGSIYKSREPLTIDLDLKKEEVYEKLNHINAFIDDFNNACSSKDKNIKEAKDINTLLSYYECESFISRYKSLTEEEKSAKQKVESLQKENDEAQAKINNLNSKKKNYSIAVDEMNNCLSFIFSSGSRLKLQASNDSDKYYVFSKGRKVKANKLSTGERNAISLVYFYEKLKQNCTQNNYFKEKSFYIIDDPISSFDYENKLGILSFIKKMVSEIKNGNEESQIIIMTHDLEIANFISRIFDDLNMSSDSCNLELKLSGTTNANFTSYNKYSELMKEVVEYGETGDEEKDSFMGNTIRRLLEAYAEFNYKETMDNFLRRNDYLDKIADNVLRDYFYSKMNRLVLHEESHARSVVRQVPDTLNFDIFSKDEKMQIAKDVIVLLYSLDKTHVKRHIPTEKERIVISWMQEIHDSFAG